MVTVENKNEEVDRQGRTAGKSTRLVFDLSLFPLSLLLALRPCLSSSSVRLSLTVETEKERERARSQFRRREGKKGRDDETRAANKDFELTE